MLLKLLNCDQDLAFVLCLLVEEFVHTKDVRVLHIQMGCHGVSVSFLHFIEALLEDEYLTSFFLD